MDRRELDLVSRQLAVLRPVASGKFPFVRMVRHDVAEEPRSTGHPFLKLLRKATQDFARQPQRSEAVEGDGHVHLDLVCLVVLIGRDGVCQIRERLTRGRRVELDEHEPAVRHVLVAAQDVRLDHFPISHVDDDGFALFRRRSERLVEFLERGHLRSCLDSLGSLLARGNFLRHRRRCGPLLARGNFLRHRRRRGPLLARANVLRHQRGRAHEQGVIIGRRARIGVGKEPGHGVSML